MRMVACNFLNKSQRRFFKHSHSVKGSMLNAAEDDFDALHKISKMGDLVVNEALHLGSNPYRLAVLSKPGCWLFEGRPLLPPVKKLFKNT